MRSASAAPAATAAALAERVIRIAGVFPYLPMTYSPTIVPTVRVSNPSLVSGRVSAKLTPSLTWKDKTKSSGLSEMSLGINLWWGCLCTYARVEGAERRARLEPERRAPGPGGAPSRRRRFAAAAIDVAVQQRLRKQG